MSAAVADSSLMQNSVNAFREQILAAKKIKRLFLLREARPKIGTVIRITTPS